jgi:hypothetical protein
MAIALFAAYYAVSNALYGYVCPSQAMIGLPCPGCGLTRAALLLAQGRLKDSFSMNPTLLPLIAGSALYFASDKLPALKNAALVTLAIAVAASFAVYFVRLPQRVGTEPYVFNRRAALGRVIPDVVESAIKRSTQE